MYFRAYVSRPDADLQVIDLLDSGVGADSEKNDGIYSRYYVDPVNPGRYNLMCIVTGSESSFIDDGQNQQQGTAIKEFNRVQSGGTFRVMSSHKFVWLNSIRPNFILLTEHII